MVLLMLGRILLSRIFIIFPLSGIISGELGRWNNEEFGRYQVKFSGEGKEASI